MNVQIPEGYSQVCIWPGTLVDENQIEDFEKYMFQEFRCRVKYLETIKTFPDTIDGTEVNGIRTIYEMYSNF